MPHRTLICQGAKSSRLRSKGLYLALVSDIKFSGSNPLRRKFYSSLEADLVRKILSAINKVKIASRIEIHIIKIVTDRSGFSAPPKLVIWLSHKI
jgi:hypothetical protein